MNELNKKTCQAQYFYTRAHFYTLAIADMSKFLANSYGTFSHLEWEMFCHFHTLPERLTLHKGVQMTEFVPLLITKNSATIILQNFPLSPFARVKKMGLRSILIIMIYEFQKNFLVQVRSNFALLWEMLTFFTHIAS